MSLGTAAVHERRLDPCQADGYRRTYDGSEQTRLRRLPPGGDGPMAAGRRGGSHTRTDRETGPSPSDRGRHAREGEARRGLSSAPAERVEDRVRVSPPLVPIGWLRPPAHCGGFHGPTPPRRSGVILVTNPCGGSGMLGNTTSGPRYVCASRCKSSGAPPSVARARPYTTRYSSKPRSFRVVGSTDSAIRGSRRRFFSLRWSGSVAMTISSLSRPTQAAVTCGLPSSSIVTTCATASLSRS